MNLRQLKTIVAFLEKGSFSFAAEHVGLSHSAVSVQMQQLEDELGTELFDRTSRPPCLTGNGQQVAELAGQALAIIGKISIAAKGQLVEGSAVLGIVPTIQQSLLPFILETLKAKYPDLQINVKLGFSGELANMTRRHEVDFAILTAPSFMIPELEVSEFASEKLFVIGPSSHSNISHDGELVEALPFIAFAKNTWLGRQIISRLQARGINANETMEVDSIDAIEKLVSEGFGVSIVPQRVLMPKLSNKLVRIPFCDPVETRKLVLINRMSDSNWELKHQIKKILLNLPD